MNQQLVSPPQSYDEFASLPLFTKQQQAFPGQPLQKILAESFFIVEEFEVRGLRRGPITPQPSADYDPARPLTLAAPFPFSAFEFAWNAWTERIMDPSWMEDGGKKAFPERTHS